MLHTDAAVTRYHHPRLREKRAHVSFGHGFTNAEDIPVAHDLDEHLGGREAFRFRYFFEGAAGVFGMRRMPLDQQILRTAYVRYARRYTRCVIVPLVRYQYLEFG
jgi:hypothetical protein